MLTNHCGSRGNDRRFVTPTARIAVLHFSRHAVARLFFQQFNNDIVRFEDVNTVKRYVPGR